MLAFIRALKHATATSQKKTGNLIFWMPDECAYRFSLDKEIGKNLDKKNIVINNSGRFVIHFHAQVDLLHRYAKDLILYENSPGGASARVVLANYLINKDIESNTLQEQALRADGKVCRAFIMQYMGATQKSLALMNDAITMKNYIYCKDITRPEMRRIHGEHGLLLFLMGKMNEAQNVYDLVCDANKPMSVKYNCKSNYERFLSNSAFFDVLNKKYDKAIERFLECMESSREDIASVAKHNLLETQFQKSNNIITTIPKSFSGNSWHI